MNGCGFTTSLQLGCVDIIHQCDGLIRTQKQTYDRQPVNGTVITITCGSMSIFSS